MSDKAIKVGNRVKVVGKDDIGTVAFVGNTLFQTGKWIGVILDEPKGKNNGTVQGKSYFSCADNHGIFVRFTQVLPIDEKTADKSPASSSASLHGSQSSLNASTDKLDKKSKITGLKTPSKSSESKSKLSKPSASKLAKPSSEASELKSSSNSSLAAASSKDTAPPSKETTAPTQEAVAPSKDAETPVEEKKPEPPAVVAETTTTLLQQQQQAVDSVHQLQEIDGLRYEVKDLKERLDTLKIKRGQDVARLKDFEKTKIQLQQLQEYKLKTQESIHDLQKQLQAAKKETESIQEQYMNFKDEMTETQETIEMATLDREMAEEKCESLQLERDQMKERLEEALLDIQLMKEEMATPAGEGVVSSLEMKQLEQQNQRLKEAIIKVRDMANWEKQEAQAVNKLCESQKSEIAALTKDKERLREQLEKIQEEVIDLKEQVDSAQGAEEMVERLTEKTLALEETVEKMQEEKDDLEQLCDMNDELQETARETELELREALDLTNAKLIESQRRTDALNDAIGDYQNTIMKFRDLVAQQQSKIKDLSSGEAPTEEVPEVKQLPTPTIEFDFKAKFAETKATAKAIETELRKLDLEQAQQHVSYLTSFMPDTFMKRGGDHEVILTLLLIPRMISKCDLILSQANQKHEVPESLIREDVVGSHKCETYGSLHNLNYHLSTLQSYLKLYENSLTICNVEKLLKISTLLPEIAVYEKTLDAYVELLKKDQLDETTSLESLDKAIQYFEHLYSVHLAQSKPNCSQLMGSQMKVLSSLTSCLKNDVATLKLSLKATGGVESGLEEFLSKVEVLNEEMKAASKKIKRHLPDNQNNATPLTFSKTVQQEMAEGISSMDKVLRVFRLVGTAAVHLLAMLEGHQEEVYIPLEQLNEVMMRSIEKIYGKADDQSFKNIISILEEACKTFKHISTAMENGEYDFDGTLDKTCLPPVVHRASAVKGEFAEVDNLKVMVQEKEEEVRELSLKVKNKQEDLGQSLLKVQVLEKKLETVNKEADDRVDRMQQKLDEATMSLKKVEKEHEDSVDALRADMEALENEKAELQRKLKDLSKKSLFAGLAKQLASPESSEPAETPVKEGGMSERTIACQRQLIRDLNLRIADLEGEQLYQDVKKLQFVPPENALDKDEEIQELRKKGRELMKECRKLLIPKLVDLTQLKKGVAPPAKLDPFKQLQAREAEKASLQRRINDFKKSYISTLSSRQVGGKAVTDFGEFPTAPYLKALSDANTSIHHQKVVASVALPSPGQARHTRLQVTPLQLHHIHSLLAAV